MIEGGEVLGEAMQWQVIDAGSRAACRSTSPYWRHARAVVPAKGARVRSARSMAKLLIVSLRVQPVMTDDRKNSIRSRATVIAQAVNDDRWSADGPIPLGYAVRGGGPGRVLEQQPSKPRRELLQRNGLTRRPAPGAERRTDIW